jgi:endonuclease/exonuclease/phosphatase (EEP) superfamily protein YafD
MAACKRQKKMAQRQQQPIISSLLILGVATLIVVVNLASDLNSPTLFLLKAVSQPITVILLIALAAYTAYARMKLVALTAVLAALINAPFLLPNYSLSTASGSQQSNDKLIATTFSTLGRTKNIDDIIGFVKSRNPDLLCLQELSQVDRQVLYERLADHYAYRLENNNNQLTLSHFPLTLDDDVGHYLVGTLRHPKWGEIEVINAHMPRPYLNFGLSKSWQKLLRHLDSHSTTLLCGDLNITPNNSLYDSLRYRYSLNDSLKSGYGFTYPNAERRSAIFGPLIRIDYIFTRGMNANKTLTLNLSNLSDHRAVITQLRPDKP